MGVTLSVIQRAEWHCENDSKGRKLLAERADSIEGLWFIGALSRDTAWSLQFHYHTYDTPELTRLSEVAAFGSKYWSDLPEMWRIVRGTGGVSRLTMMRDLLGIAWSPIDRTPKRRPPKPAQQQPATAWDDIVARVGQI